MRFFRKSFAGPTASPESDRSAAERDRNDRRLLSWFAISRARARIAEIDGAVAELYPGAPTLLSAFDDMLKIKEKRTS